MPIPEEISDMLDLVENHFRTFEAIPSSSIALNRTGQVFPLSNCFRLFLSMTIDMSLKNLDVYTS